MPRVPSNTWRVSSWAESARGHSGVGACALEASARRVTPRAAFASQGGEDTDLTVGVTFDQFLVKSPDSDIEYQWIARATLTFMFFGWCALDTHSTPDCAAPNHRAPNSCLKGLPIS